MWEWNTICLPIKWIITTRWNLDKWSTIDVCMCDYKINNNKNINYDDDNKPQNVMYFFSNKYKIDVQLRNGEQVVRNNYEKKPERKIFWFHRLNLIRIRWYSNTHTHNMFVIPTKKNPHHKNGYKYHNDDDDDWLIELN